MLVLFDIDGTLLLRSSAEHAAALREALAVVYGVDATQKVHAAGRTDTAIARDLAALGGVDAEAFEAGLEQFRELTAALFAQRCPPSLADRVAPGMGELLEALAARGDVRCSLVTGNYEAIARLKLERAGIGQHFPLGQGGFGSDAESRDELPPIARARGRLSARAHDRRRRHPARCRLRAGGRPARAGGRDRSPPGVGAGRGGRRGGGRLGARAAARRRAAPQRTSRL